MEMLSFKEIIAVVKREEERRRSELDDKEPDYASDRWQYTDRPFFNGLYLMLLVHLRHQIERELLELAARVNKGVKQITRQQHLDNVEKLKRTSKKGNTLGWDCGKVREMLNMEHSEQYGFLKPLQHLSNCYKHDFLTKPDDKLKKSLGLSMNVQYAPLDASDDVQKGFAKLLGLSEDAVYSEIAEKFIDIATDFLAEVKREKATVLSEIKPSIASFNPDTFER